jgi:Uma2 family endonuclease
MTIPEKNTNRRFTYEDYLTWKGDQRWEVIEGAAYAMSPAPSRRHQDISREIEVQIAEYLKGKECKVYYAPFDVRLPEGDENEEQIETVVQPDILVVCDKSKLDDKGCLGAPDIVIEILSPDTSTRDKIEKFALYERHGVKEYWIVDPADNTVMVFALVENREYGKPRIYSEKDSITTPILDEIAIDLKQVFE